MWHKTVSNRLWTAGPVMAVMLVHGCTVRTEKIRIQPDGAAHLTVIFEADDPADVYTGDAMLQDPGAWTVTDEMQPGEDGKETLVRTAELTLGPDDPFPTHFAGDDAELAELATTMKTAVWTEERADGTYYHFRREYGRRDWARIDYFRRKFLDDQLKKLEGKNLSDMTEEERSHVAQALLSFEGVKTMVLAEAAADALGDAVRQDDWLAIHRAIVGVFEDFDKDKVLQILALEGDEADSEIAQAVQQVNELLESKIEDVLAGRDSTGRLAALFMEQFEKERRRYAITEDLQNERWEVQLELPGQIIGHNSLEGDAKGGEVSWHFDADALFDRDQVLMATSVVEHD